MVLFFYCKYVGHSGMRRTTTASVDCVTTGWALLAVALVTLGRLEALEWHQNG